MPQMSPLNWISLFLAFSMIFMLINSTNYFFLMYNSKSNIKSLKKYMINWKWYYYHYYYK